MQTMQDKLCAATTQSVCGERVSTQHGNPNRKNSNSSQHCCHLLLLAVDISAQLIGGLGVVDEVWTIRLPELLDSPTQHSQVCSMNRQVPPCLFAQQEGLGHGGFSCR